MIQYILECTAFQLLFLIIYDLFLKRETFFQWNRVYLIGTFVLSLLLPWIKIEAFKTTVSSEYFVYPEYLWGMDMSNGVVVSPENSSTLELSPTEIVFCIGVVIAAILFAFKLYQINRLKAQGEIRYFKDFTRVVVHNSNIAFSFFRSIFLGDQVLEKEHQSIIKHELVHIEQRHSWDLLFFELMRIIGWFNPLVYVYQNRVSELHEFIADAKVAKTHKAEQYQLLLSQVFQTQHISFINQFFKSSLIKKRIVMLQKSKSKKVWQLKYLLLVPLVAGMLVYTSLEAKEKIGVENEQTLDDASLIKEINEEIKKQVQEKGSIGAVHFDFAQRKNLYSDNGILSKYDYFESRILSKLNFKEMFEVSKGTFPDMTNKMVDPTSAAYDTYVRSKKAFQLLDRNLSASIDAYKLHVMLLDHRESFSEDYYLFEVKNTNDLTWIELRALNGKLEEIFESENSTYKNLIITDGLYDFLVFNTVKNNKISILNNAAPNQDEVDVPFAQVEKVPVFPGCDAADNKRDCFQQQIQKHISKNFRYPQEAQEKGIQGRVNIMFVIQKDGSIANVRMRGPDKILEAEAARIISLLPKMDPGEHKGKKVRVPFSIPITFKLQREDEFGTKENDDGTVDVAFAIIDKVPVFPGCEDASDPRACFNEKLQRHIGKNFRYPEEAQEKGIQGRVNLMFIIGEDGSIGNVRMRGPDKLLEDEAARIISLLPQMAPGEHKGKKVRVPFSIPITFKLQGGNDFELIDELSSSNLITKYNNLVVERRRLLQKTDVNDPIIINLDQQLNGLKSQIISNDVAVPFAVIEVVPVFPGCEDAEDKRDCFNAMLQKHIGKNFRYPEEAQEKGIQGRVNVMFTIQEDGNIGNVRMRGPDKLLEDEAARIISLLPQMTPGEQKGKKARVPFSIPITFKLQGPVENESSQSPSLGLTSNKMSIEASVKIVGSKQYLRGMVTDGSKGVPGVNVSVQGENKAVVTDFDGVFEIEAKKGDVLTFQHIGLPLSMLAITHKQKYHITNN